MMCLCAIYTMHVQKCIHIFVYNNAYVCAHVYVFVCIYIYIYIYIYTYIFIKSISQHACLCVIHGGTLTNVSVRYHYCHDGGDIMVVVAAHRR
jgi:hypothetical protein